MKNIEILYADPQELVLFEDNAKRHTDEQIEQIARSISEFGFNDPIAVDENMVIIEGHGRLIAAQNLGLKMIPYFVLRGMTEEQKSAYRLVHNQTTINTGFDPDLLAQELSNINEIDMEQFSFFEDQESFFDLDKPLDKKEKHEIVVVADQDEAEEIRGWLDENGVKYKEKHVR